MWGCMSSYIIEYNKDVNWYMKSYLGDGVNRCRWTNSLLKAHLFTSDDLATNYLTKYLSDRNGCIVRELLINVYTMEYFLKETDQGV